MTSNTDIRTESSVGAIELSNISRERSQDGMKLTHLDVQSDLALPSLAANKVIHAPALNSIRNGAAANPDAFGSDFDKKAYNHMYNVLYKHEEHKILDMEALQQISTEYLRREVALCASRLLDRENFSSYEVLEKLTPAIRDYVGAVRDLEFMTNDPGPDPFILSTQRSSHKWFFKGLESSTRLRESSEPFLTEDNSWSKAKRRQDLEWGGREEEPVRQVKWLPSLVEEFSGIYKNRRRARRRRFLINDLPKALLAVVGSFIIIWPIIFILFSTLSPAEILAYVSIAIVMFAFSTSFHFRTFGESLCATTAHAAVLVVFLGTN